MSAVDALVGMYFILKKWYDNIFQGESYHLIYFSLGKQIFEKVIGPTGLLRSKARIFVTHGIHNLSSTNSVVMLREGRIIEQGHFDTLMKEKKELFNLISEYGQEIQGLNEEDEEISSPTTLETYEINEATIGSHTEEASGSPRERRVSVASLRRRPSVMVMNNKKQEIETSERDALITKEESAKGKVVWPVYQAYINSCSKSAVALYLFMMILGQGVQIGVFLFLGAIYDFVKL